MLDVGEQRGLECGVGQLVHSKGSEQGVGSHAGDKVGAAAENTRLWAAQQLVATVADYVCAGLQTVQHARFATDSDGAQVEQRAASQVFHQRNVSGAGQSREFLDRRLLGESGNLEIGAVHAQQQLGLLVDRSLVVGHPSAVGRAYLAQSGV